MSMSSSSFPKSSLLVSSLSCSSPFLRSFRRLPRRLSVGARSLSSSGGGAAAGLSFAKRNPFAFQVIVATVKTSAADLVTQVVAEKKGLKDVDWRRNGVFVVFGTLYLGCFQWFIMVTKYRVWFPTMDAFSKLPFKEKLKHTAGMKDAAKMVLFDVFVHMPMMYFPAYYTIKESIFGDSWSPITWATTGLTKYYKNFYDDFTAMAKLWGPSDCVQFVLPLHLRMPFRHAVSFFWTSYVSFTRGGK